MCGESVVELTTVVDLSVQLSNLREVILHLSEELNKHVGSR
jgi:hypothetical protein